MIYSLNHHVYLHEIIVFAFDLFGFILFLIAIKIRKKTFVFALIYTKPNISNYFTVIIILIISFNDSNDNITTTTKIILTILIIKKLTSLFQIKIILIKV